MNTKSLSASTYRNGKVNIKPIGKIMILKELPQEETTLETD